MLALIQKERTMRRLHACRHLRRLSTDEAGATAVEYALMASAIAGVVAAAAFALGPTVAELFERATRWP